MDGLSYVLRRMQLVANRIFSDRLLKADPPPSSRNPGAPSSSPAAQKHQEANLKHEKLLIGCSGSREEKAKIAFQASCGIGTGIFRPPLFPVVFALLLVAFSASKGGGVTTPASPSYRLPSFDDSSSTQSGSDSAAADARRWGRMSVI
ncbi:hypothetical protein H105_02611 [Trichophyton soudanense CBS 452.61]|uniref:Uncharacterized protein n=1 Tax=Trichophyton soudanense CBS 452.61 TaxID=1215331 RepID=A0A022XZD7_TRISD|nr:hypothetical protein H105_02611 [Trichophyton soudanense CBS 452.61]EZG08279.1 hypothetical protein H106_02464 [Trichophyton rubrum CBS 735.88]